jgi:HAMP domain-containing protein
MSSDFEDLPDSRKEPLRIVVPLLGTDTDLTHDERFAGVTLGRLTDKDRRVIAEDLRIFPHGGYPDADMFSQSQLCLSVTTVEDDIDAADWLHPLGQDVVRALRLLHEGDVGATSTFAYAEHADSSTHAHGDLATAVRRPRLRYRLTAAELPAVAALLDSLRDAVVRESLAVALRRFHQSYTRTDPEDQIIDLTVALESSLLAGLTDELVYRLGLRGAALLGAARDPAAVSQLLRALYIARSQIVHEGRTLSDLMKGRDSAAKDFQRTVRQSGQRLEISHLLQAFEEIVRQVLRAYAGRLSVLDSHPEDKPILIVNRSLDETVLRGLLTTGALSQDKGSREFAGQSLQNDEKGLGTTSGETSPLSLRPISGTSRS